MGTGVGRDLATMVVSRVDFVIDGLYRVGVDVDAHSIVDRAANGEFRCRSDPCTQMTSGCSK